VAVRVLLIVALLGGLTACGLFTEEQPHYTAQVELTEPWSKLALPLDGATVTFSDRETVSLHHTQGDVPALAASYRQSLQAAGWALEHDGSAGEIVSQTWTRGEQSLSFTVQSQGGVRVASLALLAF
jgi:hypothetical protein